MFVRFPIILARPTSLRGSLSPDLWQKVIGRTPGGVFPRTVTPRRWKTKLWALLFLLCFWCDKPWKNTQRGRLGFVFCVCVCVPVFLPCASHPITQTPGLPRCLVSPAPPPNPGRCGCCRGATPHLRSRPGHRACAWWGTACCVPCLCCPPVCVPPVSVLVPPRVVRSAGRLCLRFISPCSPLPACSDGQDTQFGEGFLTSISLGPPG